MLIVAKQCKIHGRQNSCWESFVDERCIPILIAAPLNVLLPVLLAKGFGMVAESLCVSPPKDLEIIIGGWGG